MRINIQVVADRGFSILVCLLVAPLYPIAVVLGIVGGWVEDWQWKRDVSRRVKELQSRRVYPCRHNGYNMDATASCAKCDAFYDEEGA